MKNSFNRLARQDCSDLRYEYLTKHSAKAGTSGTLTINKNHTYVNKGSYEQMGTGFESLRVPQAEIDEELVCVGSSRCKNIYC